jgi:hypothetical protein
MDAQGLPGGDIDPCPALSVSVHPLAALTWSRLGSAIARSIRGAHLTTAPPPHSADTTQSGDASVRRISNNTPYVPCAWRRGSSVRATTWITSFHWHRAAPTIPRIYKHYVTPTTRKRRPATTAGSAGWGRGVEIASTKIFVTAAASLIFLCTGLGRYHQLCQDHYRKTRR